MTEPKKRLSLLEAYSELRPEKRVCTVGKIIGELDETDREVLSQWLADDHMTSYSVSRLLTHVGHVVHRNTVADHRNGSCLCNR